MGSESAMVVLEHPHEIEASPAERGVAQFEAYQALQKALDSMMPEQIITIRGRKFRRKGYWRAVAKGFRVTTEVVREERVETDGDWGYLFIVRATNQGGESAEGDGACMASEKVAGQASLHNVRAHAFTRAKNRAISDLVGFGEVSAEEMEREERPASRDVTPQRAPAPSGRLASEKQTKLVWARAKAKGDELGVGDDDVAGALKSVCADLGFASRKEITGAAVDTILHAIEGWTLATFGEAEPQEMETSAELPF